MVVGYGDGGSDVGDEVMEDSNSGGAVGGEGL